MHGTGTEQVEEVLRTNFKKVPIIRVDHDTTKKVGAMEDIINEINSSESAILVGTQMNTELKKTPVLAMPLV